MTSLSKIIEKLTKKKLITEDDSYLLMENFGYQEDLFTNISETDYNLELRQFALTLHFFSAKAYNYARENFYTVLPYQHTLGKWCCHTNAEPGFTKKALNFLKLKVKNNNKPIYCALMFNSIQL